ncbi:hypothetical protein pb186bvf_013238 [Paramecium bursaria]
MQRLYRFKWPIRLAIPILFTYYNRPTIKLQAKQYAIPVDQTIFIKDILAPKDKEFFLIIYKPEIDDGLGEREAIKIAQQLSQSFENIQIFMVSRPNLTKLQNIVSRIKGLKIFDEGKTEQIEIFYKSTQSEEYVYINFDQRKFYNSQKQQKIIQRVSKFRNLIINIKTKEELCDQILENYYILDNPILLKKGNDKSVISTYFKESAFKFIERKIHKQDTKYLIIDNPDLIKELGLKDGDIKIFRNDILQKYQTCELMNGKLAPALTLQGMNKQQTIDYFKDQLESFQQWKQTQPQLQEPQVEGFEGFFQEAQIFTLPRVILMNEYKRAVISNLLRKFEQSKKEKLALSLYVDQNNQHNKDQQERIIKFFNLNRIYQDKFIYIIAASDQFEEMMPHLNKFQSPFVLFNVYSKIPTKSSPFFQSVNTPYEKYYIREDQPEKQINQLLNLSQEDRLKQSHFIQQEIDKIQEINLYFFQGQMKKCKKSVILYYQSNQYTDKVMRSILKYIKNYPEASIFSMSQFNQIPAIKSRFPSQNVLIFGDQVYGLPDEENYDHHIKVLFDKYL